jgi:hypothetical protein
MAPRQSRVGGGARSVSRDGQSGCGAVRGFKATIQRLKRVTDGKEQLLTHAIRWWGRISMFPPLETPQAAPPARGGAQWRRG